MRVAFKMKLKPGFASEYKKRHSIFLDPETNILFAVQENNGQGSQDLGQLEIVKKWWAYMADIMETNPDNSPISKPLQEVFYLP
jgi:L-rhamnose mutarotase